jgi:hypothetical protein
MVLQNPFLEQPFVNKVVKLMQSLFDHVHPFESAMSFEQIFLTGSLEPYGQGSILSTLSMNPPSYSIITFDLDKLSEPHLPSSTH